MLFGIAFFVLLGFLLAWLTGVVSGEEITVGEGFMIVIGAGVLGFGANYLLAMVLGPVALFTSPVVAAASIAVLVKLVAKGAEWKHCAIIGGIYAALLTVVVLLIRS